MMMIGSFPNRNSKDKANWHVNAVIVGSHLLNMSIINILDCVHYSGYSEQLLPTPSTEWKEENINCALSDYFTWLTARVIRLHACSYCDDVENSLHHTSTTTDPMGQNLLLGSSGGVFCICVIFNAAAVLHPLSVCCCTWNWQETEAFLILC